MDWGALLIKIGQTALALFVIIDPLGGLPVFASLLRSMPPQRQRQTVNMGVLVAVLILLLFATVGMRMLGLFDVGLPELMIAGGVMLMIVGLNEVFGFLPETSTYRENVGIVPMACPLLAGPGAIVTLMLAMKQTPPPAGYVVMLAGVALAMGASWLILRYTHALIGVLGTRGSLVVAKLMGIVVTAIGAHFILRGVMDFWTQTQPPGS